MVYDLRRDAYRIINKTIDDLDLEKSVIEALKSDYFNDDFDNIFVVAIGKAAWSMANAVKSYMGNRIQKGIVITKYGHSKGKIDGFDIVEASHPIPDINSIIGTKKALNMVKDLTINDKILFLVSGGGSSLFELPMPGINLNQIIDITDQLLRSGAEISELNTVRKRLSSVKGGRFAEICKNIKIYSIVLSDVLGDSLDAIASGPAYCDKSTSAEAIDIIERYNIKVDDKVLKTLSIETPKLITDSKTMIIGNVKRLCKVAQENANKLGYSTTLLTSTLECEAKEAGKFVAAIAREYNSRQLRDPKVFILGGETTVKVSGNGKGGRNQELALSASIGIEGLKNVVVVSFASDGTDGPTDAAGAIVDGYTVNKIRDKNISPRKMLENNDSYNALKLSEDLIFTGSTGTNLNDLIIIMVK